MDTDILRAAGMAVLGVIYAFFGYRWTRAMTRMAAGVFFAVAAGLIADGRVDLWLQLAIVLAAGIVGYLLGDAVYYLLVILTGAAAGALLAAAPAGGTENAAAWVLLLGAAAGGLLAVLLEKPIVIVATSILGGFLLAAVTQFALSGTLPRGEFRGDLGPAALAAWAGFTALGALAQAVHNRRRVVVVAPAESVAVAEVNPVAHVRRVRRVRWFHRRRVG
jgi:hypothetical protein